MKKKLSAGKLALILIGCTLAMPLVLLAFAWLWPSGAIRISKETTYLTEPLTAHGKIDYLAAIEHQYASGITAENNAAAPIVALLSPDHDAWNQIDRNHIATRLGVHIDDLYPNGPWLINLSEFAIANRQAYLRTAELTTHDDGEAGSYVVDDGFDLDRTNLWVERAKRHPWSDEQFPLLDSWLTANSAACSQLTEAVRRSACYFPIAIPKDAKFDSLVYYDSYWSWILGDAESLLAIRVMRSVQEKRLDDAWEDVQTLYLLAAHMQSQPMGQGNGSRIEESAAIALGCLLYYGRPDQVMLKSIQEFLVSLPPLPDLQDELRTTRFVMLDFLQLQPAHELVSWTSLPEFTARGIDWNVAMQEVNENMDEIAAMAALPTATERLHAVVSIFDDADFHQHPIQEAAIWALSREGRTRQLINDAYRSDFMGARIAIRWHAYLQMVRDCTRLAVALESHRSEHGKYPESLKELARAVQPFPTDPWNARPILYRKFAEGYAIYSVGEDLVDDGGLNVMKDDAVWDIELSMEDEREVDPSLPPIHAHRLDDDAYRVPAWTEEDVRDALLTPPAADQGQPEQSP